MKTSSSSQERIAWAKQNIAEIDRRITDYEESIQKSKDMIDRLRLEKAKLINYLQIENEYGGSEGEFLQDPTAEGPPTSSMPLPELLYTILSQQGPKTSAELVEIVQNQYSLLKNVKYPTGSIGAALHRRRDKVVNIDGLWTLSA